MSASQRSRRNALTQQKSDILAQQQFDRLEQQHSAMLANQRIDALQAAIDAERSERLAQIALIEHVLTEAASPVSPRTADKKANPAGKPEVSIIMPVYDRAGIVGQAIDSVVAQSFCDWELLVVDDGSTDDIEGALAPYGTDARIRLLRQPHRSASAARNAGLEQARGSVIAYLDSDNVWASGFLASAVQALRSDNNHDLVYGILATAHHGLGERLFLFHPFDREALLSGNYIDINVVAHRASLFLEFGGFDQNRKRLGDWDIVLRYTAKRPALLLPVVAARYRVMDGKRISDTTPAGPDTIAIQAKWYPPDRLRRPLRVLYVVWHYPQLSESYIETELACMRRWGVHVEV
jgi:hypothetical protein